MRKGSEAEISQVAGELLSQRMWWLLVVCVLPIGIPSCGLGIVGTISVFSYDQWWQKVLGLFGAILGLGSPLWIVFGLRWLHRIPARSMLQSIMALETKVANQCLELIQQPVYYNATVGWRGGAIAVNPATAQIALVFGELITKRSPQTRDIKFDVRELRQWRAIDPGATLIEVSGGTSDQLLGALNHNVRARNERAQGTGLQLITDRLDATEIFLNFDFDEAKKWVLLLTKLSEGRLEVPVATIEYPFPSAA